MGVLLIDLEEETLPEVFWGACPVTVCIDYESFPYFKAPMYFWVIS